MITKRHEDDFQKHGVWLPKSWRLDVKIMEIGCQNHGDWTPKSWRLKFIPHAPGEAWL